MYIFPLEGIHPQIKDTVYIAPNAAIVGDVKIDDYSNIWYSCTLRGDEKEIHIGKNTNIQDNSVIHVATKVQGTFIGNNVTIGHGCIIHACTIGNDCLIGMGSTILDGAVIEDNAMVAAGSLVTPGKKVPSGQLWAGRPAKFMRDLSDEDFAHIQWSSENYLDLARKHTKILQT